MRAMHLLRAQKGKEKIAERQGAKE